MVVMKALFLQRLTLFAPLLLASGCSPDSSPPASEFLEVGGMHETIGNQQHEGRIGLAEVTSKGNFYGVGALENLKGEITILDSEAIVTGVSEDGSPRSLAEPASLKAAMLVGQSVDEWKSIPLPEAILHEDIDQAISKKAVAESIDLTRPFPFVIEGTFEDVRLHVINGACPIRARMKKLEIPKEESPFEFESGTITGTLVGIYAEDSVGKLTHPDTSIHAHLLYKDPATGETVTGHIEQVGLGADTVLKLPKQ